MPECRGAAVIASPLCPVLWAVIYTLQLVAYQIEHYLSPDGRDRFAEWLAALADRRARAFAVVRIGRMGGGAFGDCKPMGGGVWEARIDYGPGYRVYYARAGGRLILLLTGGDKRRQDADIARAIDYWQDWQRRNAS